MSDKRKAFEAIVAKLEKLLPHLGDENTHEAGAALQKINSLLHAAKLEWHDLLALMSEQTEGSVFSDLLRSNSSLVHVRKLTESWVIFRTSNLWLWRANFARICDGKYGKTSPAKLGGSRSTRIRATCVIASIEHEAVSVTTESEKKQ